MANAEKQLAENTESEISSGIAVENGTEQLEIKKAVDPVSEKVKKPVSFLEGRIATGASVGMSVIIGAVREVFGFAIDAITGKASFKKGLERGKNAFSYGAKKDKKSE